VDGERHRQFNILRIHLKLHLPVIDLSSYPTPIEEKIEFNKHERKKRIVIEKNAIHNIFMATQNSMKEVSLLPIHLRLN